MAANYIQPGDTITVTAGGAASSGDGLLVGDTFGICSYDVVSGGTVELVTRGVFTMPKAAGALSQGDAVYWDDTAKNVTATTSGNTKIGVVIEDVTSGGTTAPVRLNGSF